MLHISQMYILETCISKTQGGKTETEEVMKWTQTMNWNDSQIPPHQKFQNDKWFKTYKMMEFGVFLDFRNIKVYIISYETDTSTIWFHIGPGTNSQNISKDDTYT
jgi:hypothetical protein